MKILLTGRTGQIGYELERSLQGLAEIIAVDRQQMDLADLKQVRDVIRAIKPQLIINAAAYTDVERAERDPELAMRINGDAPGVMAEEARRLGAAIIHYSTDYVFDGTKGSPYTEDDVPNPINSYGSSKLAGESAVAAAGIPYFVLRTSWVYGLRGKNFLTRLLRMARQGGELRIVNDQHGAPTWCHTVAQATTRMVVKYAMQYDDDVEWRAPSGIYHLTAQGQTTWFGFAKEIASHACVRDNLIVIPIDSREYPSIVARPSNSIMSCSRFMGLFGLLPAWNQALRDSLG